MSALMNIIIRAQDKASEVAQKVSNKFQGAGDKISKVLDKTSQAGDRFTGTLVKTGQSGISAYAQLNTAQLKYVQGVNKVQQTLDRMGISGTRAATLILQGYDLVHNGINKVKSGVDSLKNKIASTTVGNALITGFNRIETKVRQVGSTISSALGKGLDSAKTKVENLNNSMGELGTAVTSVFGAIGLGSIYQATIGLSMTRERMTALMTATMQSSSAAKEFVGTLDTMTNNSLVSLNDLGNAMSKIKMSTGMTNEQLKLIAPTVNDIGQRALLMGKDTGEAQELMTASFRGLNGEFDMLKSNFGITRQSLIDAGWSGAATDVAGYNTALQAVLARGGDMNGMLQTTPGMILLVQKGFSTAGRQIGETFLPAIKMFLGFMVSLKATNPVVFKLIIVIAALVSAFALMLPVMGVLIGSFKSFLIFMGLIQGAENATTLATVRSTASRWLNTASNYAQAAATGVLSAAQSVYTAVTNGTVGATIANTIAKYTNTAATATNTGVTESAIGAAMAHAGAVDINTASTNTGIISTIRSGASYVIHRAAVLASAAATWILSGATAILTAIMDANPIMLIVLALAALAAGLIWAYYNVEPVRNAINFLFNGLKSLGGYIVGGFMAAWAALVVLFSPITDALGRLWAAIMKVWNSFVSGKSAQANSTFAQVGQAAQSLWVILVALGNFLLSVLTPVWNALLPVLIAVGTVITGFLGASFRTIWGILGSVIGFIARFINILADLISGNITFGQALQQIWGSFQVMIYGILQSIILGIGAFVLDLALKGIQAGQSFVTNLINWLVSLPAQIAFWLGFVIGRILLWNIQLQQRAMQAGRNFVMGLISFIQSLPGRIWAYLNLAVARILMWKNSVVMHARLAGIQFVSNVVSFIQSLPGRVWSFLLSTIAKIISFAGQAVSNARSAGNQIVTGFSEYIHNLPSIMWTELMNVGQAILNAGGQLYQYAVDLGTNIVNGLKAGAGIHSPGYMYHAINNELGLIDTTLTEAKDKLGKKATDVGSSISDGFSNNLTTPNIKVPSTTQTVTQPSAVTASSASTVPSAGVNLDVPGLTAQTTAAQAVVSSNVAFVSGKYNLLSTNTKTAWTAMVNNQKLNLTSMKNGMATTLNSIVAQNKKSYSDMQNTTRNTLNNLTVKTTSSIKGVKDSWNGMRDNLVQAAETIKSNVGSDINNLSSNIGTFYSKVRNPAMFLAGHPTGYAGRRPSIPRGSFAGRPSSMSNRSNLNSLDANLPTVGCVDPPCYAGVDLWNVSSPWTSNIEGSVHGYDPIFPPFDGFGKTVGDFENSTMPIMGDTSAFKQIAGYMIGKTAYQYYFNSKGGSPYSIYQSGGFNCYDGALIMLQLASAFGLGGYMAHGTWNGIPHAWAVINGIGPMDTTAFQDGYGWTSPKVSGYAGSPKISNLGQTQSSVPSGPIEINLNETHKFIINLEGVPTNMSEEELKTWLLSVITDEDVLRTLTKDKAYKEKLLEELARAGFANDRSQGKGVA